MPNFFSNNGSTSKLVSYGAPVRAIQRAALAQDTYWTILNADLLAITRNDEKLNKRANACKVLLQTYGPTADIPDLRNNVNANRVYHGHVNSSNKTVYVLEWTVVDVERKLIALLGFDTHENYSFRKSNLNAKECQDIISLPKNQVIIRRAEIKIAEAKEKEERIRVNSAP